MWNLMDRDQTDGVVVLEAARERARIARVWNTSVCWMKNYES